MKLRRLQEWEPFLLRESRLPGPRGNLELLEAVADEGTAHQFLAMVARTVEQAPSGTPGEFVAACGAAGLGERIARGEVHLWPKLRALASDPRWRVREGVAMGLQRIGDRDMVGLLKELRSWTEGSPLERRAVVAGLSEPRLLRNQEHAAAVVAVVDEVTKSLENDQAGPKGDVRILRQGLGYCWSVAVAAAPNVGKERFERWVDSDEPDIRWIVRENLKKKRLEKVGAAWVNRLRDRVGRWTDGTSR